MAVCTRWRKSERLMASGSSRARRGGGEEGLSALRKCSLVCLYSSGWAKWFAPRARPRQGVEEALLDGAFSSNHRTQPFSVPLVVACLPALEAESVVVGERARSKGLTIDFPSAFEKLTFAA